MTARMDDSTCRLQRESRRLFSPSYSTRVQNVRTHSPTNGRLRRTNVAMCIAMSDSPRTRHGAAAAASRGCLRTTA